MSKLDISFTRYNGHTVAEELWLFDISPFQNFQSNSFGTFFMLLLEAMEEECRDEQMQIQHEYRDELITYFKNCIESNHSIMIPLENIRTFLTLCRRNENLCNVRTLNLFWTLLKFDIPRSRHLVDYGLLNIDEFINYRSHLTIGNRRVNPDKLLSTVEFITSEKSERLYITDTTYCNDLVDLCYAYLYQLFSMGRVVKTCKNCGKQFISVDGEEYCSRISPQDNSKLCSEFKQPEQENSSQEQTAYNVQGKDQLAADTKSEDKSAIFSKPAENTAINTEPAEKPAANAEPAEETSANEEYSEKPAVDAESSEQTDSVTPTEETDAVSVDADSSVYPEDISIDNSNAAVALTDKTDVISDVINNQDDVADIADDNTDVQEIEIITQAEQSSEQTDAEENNAGKTDDIEQDIESDDKSDDAQAQSDDVTEEKVQSEDNTQADVSADKTADTASNTKINKPQSSSGDIREETSKLHRQIYMRMQMLVKRNPDNKNYAEAFDKYKLDVKAWKKDIKSGAKTGEQFLDWLIKTKEEGSK